MLGERKHCLRLPSFTGIYADPSIATITISASIPKVSPATMPAMKRSGVLASKSGIVQHGFLSLVMARKYVF